MKMRDIINLVEVSDRETNDLVGKLRKDRSVMRLINSGKDAVSEIKRNYGVDTLTARSAVEKLYMELN